VIERVLAGLAVVPFLLGTAMAPDDEPQVAFTFQDDQIIESSGLAVAGGLVATTNDSGDTGRVFAVDPETGETVGTTGWGNAVQDVEALAPLGDREVWVGDIGDNLEQRDSIQVAPVPVARGSSDLDGPIYDLVYPDGPHDAETLLCDPTTGRLYVATKSPLGGTLYAAPATLDAGGPNELEPLGDVLPIATDGTFLADGSRLVIRNYAVAAVYAFPSLERIDQFRLPSQEQGEGIAVDRDGSLLLSTEGLHTDVLRVSVPAEPTGGASASPSPGPSSTETQAPATVSREDAELPGSTQTERPVWPWLMGGLIGLGCVVVLTLSLRRPSRRN
jgi:hypothetical protein